MLRHLTLRLGCGLTALWLLTACPGPTAPAPGGACSTEGTASCEAANAQLLQCRANVWASYSDCRGGGGCAVEADVVRCDTSGNTVGDRCPPTSEGKVRCDPDAGANILRCVDGGLVVEFPCPTGKACAVLDAGLSCY
jgi:hypothetical protein